MLLSGVWTSNTSWQIKSAFMEFLREPAPRKISDEQLMIELAARAKNLSDDIQELVALNPGEGIDRFENYAIKALRDLKKLLEKEHDPYLHTEERFSKAIAQVLVFGLFYAHRHLSRTVKEPSKLKKQLHDFWIQPIKANESNKLRPFRALADILEAANKELSGVNLWYSDTVLLLSYVKLSKNQSINPNYHSLYENFLNYFDPRDRIDFGAYATPKELARFIIEFSESIASQKFTGSIFQSGNKIIEPCCGTGTFLEELLMHIKQQKIKNKSIPAMAGFEILAAPYALSQYRLFQLNLQGIQSAKSVNIVLCNTFSDKITNSSVQKNLNASPKNKVKNLLKGEIDEAANFTKSPITLVIGNPPSSDAGIHTDKKTSKTILKLVDDFRPPKKT